MKFSKYRNPNKRRRRKTYDYTTRTIMAGKDMITDREMGICLPKEYYEDKWRIDNGYSKD